MGEVVTDIGAAQVTGAGSGGDVPGCPWGVRDRVSRDTVAGLVRWGAVIETLANRYGPDREPEDPTVFDRLIEGLHHRIAGCDPVLGGDLGDLLDRMAGLPATAKLGAVCGWFGGLTSAIRYGLIHMDGGDASRADGGPGAGGRLVIPERSERSSTYL